MVGKTISHYKVTGELGRGGMAVVYKAEDTKLKRFVALKFLRSDLLEDEEHRERFLREAQAAAALDHSNICTVYEIDEVEGKTFIAMAFIEGPTVKDKIAERPLKLEEALDITIQTAHGLQAAHEKGIVHRDIKSANLMVTAQGQVKVMDFGLAQLAERSQLTKTATILGTPAYMSPEQAKRQPTDRRTDIWSLGVVIYEMVTGRLPFAGERQEAVLYAIGNEDPEPITALRAGLPMELEFIVGKALAKDAADRYQHVEEMIVDLRALERRAESGGASAKPSGKPVTAASWERPARARRRGLAWAGAAAALVLAIAGVSVWNLLRTTEAPLEPMRVVPLTTYPGAEMTASFPPGGNQVAFPWTGGNTESFDIYIKVVGPGPPLLLTTHPDWDGSPAWSPDGRHIAFLSGRSEAGEKMGLYLISPLGGRERKLAETRVPSYALGTCLAWSPDSRWLAVCDWAEDSPGPLGVFLLSVDSGERRRLTRPPEDSVVGDVMPAFSPDGRTLAFSRYSSGLRSDLYLLDLDEDLNPRGEPRRRTFMERQLIGAMPQSFTSDGRDIVFSAASSLTDSSGLWRVPVSGTASPERLPFGEVGIGPQLSRQGNRLAYTETNLNFNIYRLNLPVADGVTGTAVKFISSSRWDPGQNILPTATASRSFRIAPGPRKFGRVTATVRTRCS